MSEQAPVYFYCEFCDKHQPVTIERLECDKLNPHSKPWGDIVCKECHFVIATISTDEEGEYGFVRLR